MKPKEFFTILAKYKSFFKLVNSLGNQLYIRSKDNDYCPITKICLEKTGKHYSLCEWREAAEELQLNKITAVQLQESADGYMKKYRKQLLEATGLTK